MEPQPITEFALKVAKDRQDLVRKARKNLEQAQERQKKYYDSKRASFTLSVGGLVLLDTKNLVLKTINAHMELKKAKLTAKKVGSFEIISMINPNVAKLKIPRNLKRLHPSFNVDLLCPYMLNVSEFAVRPISKAAPIILEADTGKELHILKQVLRRRQRSRQVIWLVKWHNLPECDITWDREKAIRHVSHWQRLVHDFRDHQREVKSGEMSCRRVAQYN
uniref:Chromo domain-containing protein n=1 Tax=Peronospora matthiolae TaxID=2874970 RepID=A0AAV1UNZ2_9STRA